MAKHEQPLSAYIERPTVNPKWSVPARLSLILLISIKMNFQLITSEEHDDGQGIGKLEIGFRTKTNEDKADDKRFQCTKLVSSHFIDETHIGQIGSATKRRENRTVDWWHRASERVGSRLRFGRFAMRLDVNCDKWPDKRVESCKSHGRLSDR